MIVGTGFAASAPLAVADPIEEYLDIDCLLFGEGVPVECVLSGPCVEIECFTCPPEIVEACGAVDELLAPKIITCSGGGSTAMSMETKLAGAHLTNEPGSSHWTAVFDSSVAPWELKSMYGHVRTPTHSVTYSSKEIWTWTFTALPVQGYFGVHVRCTPNPLDSSQGIITSADHHGLGFPLIDDLPLIELRGTTCVFIC
ncbi:MAG TPA: hypothetical protein VM889_07090 [Candidatus Thermoplasmatota archaeon]|nr:hypothetical protein [Candidatus Thermoplasmatota archaeon]